MQRVLIYIGFIFIILSCKNEYRKTFSIVYESKDKILKYESHRISFKEDINSIIGNFGSYEKRYFKKMSTDFYYSKLYPILISSNDFVIVFSMKFNKGFNQYRCKYKYDEIKLYLDNVYIDNYSTIETVKKELDKNRINYNISENTISINDLQLRLEMEFSENSESKIISLDIFPTYEKKKLIVQ